MKKKLYYWSSDTRAISGEGILAKKFLKDLSTIFKNYKFISINKFKDNNYNSLYSMLTPMPQHTCAHTRPHAYTYTNTKVSHALPNIRPYVYGIVHTNTLSHTQ